MFIHTREKPHSCLLHYISFEIWVLKYRWSIQKPKGQYRDHLVGQLTTFLYALFQIIWSCWNSETALVDSQWREKVQWGTHMIIHMGESCTFVNSATHHSIELKFWGNTRWHTLEKSHISVPFATNHSIKLEIWEDTWSSTLERSQTNVTDATNNSVMLELWRNTR